MANPILRVYLDHHIRRDNLLYRRQETPQDLVVGSANWLGIEQLRDKKHLLRKPDFQRATWAWSPEDCVSLLKCVLDQQVIPSVILWLSPERHWYVLDGGHRLSVVLAWIEDDWGDRRTHDEYRDERLRQFSAKAGRQVRELLKKNDIAPFQEYLDAERRYVEVTAERGRPEKLLSAREQQFSLLVRQWQSESIGFPLLWVKGDYERAEQSFININKSGRRLSPWETTLVEHRNSSFARAVMSISHVTDKEHCWPSDDPAVQSDPYSRSQIAEILELVEDLHALLFEPAYETPIRRPDQPLLAPPYSRPEMKPGWLSELLTIAEGNKGQATETRKLLKRDSRAPVRDMVAQGNLLLRNAKDVVDNILGLSPRSLGLQPLVYFYNQYGTYVRSLLYGMVFWLNRGSEADILARKKVFTLHRGSFEAVLLDKKDAIIARIGRRIGSGPEVTLPTALYFNGLLELLIEYRDEVNLMEFQQAHDRLLEDLGAQKEAGEEQSDKESTQRAFRGKAKAGVVVRDFLKSFLICDICGGRYYPDSSTQVDHRVEYSKGGRTTVENGRLLHNFCNNNRKTLEELAVGSITVVLPRFDDPRTSEKVEQLEFLFLTDDLTEDPGSEYYEGSDESELDELDLLVEDGLDPESSDAD